MKTVIVRVTPRELQKTLDAASARSREQLLKEGFDGDEVAMDQALKEHREKQKRRVSDKK